MKGEAMSEERDVAVFEADEDKLIIYALTRTGCWLPLFECDITYREGYKIYREPLILKVVCAGQDSQ